MSNLHTVRAGTAHARFFSRKAGSRLATAVSAVMLAACGGGGVDADTGLMSESSSLAKVTTGFPMKPSTPVTLTPVPSTPVAAPPQTIGGPLTDVRIHNTGAAQTNVPFTFGQVIAAGQMASSQGLAAKLPDGTVLPLQADIKATHADGSVRHVVISGILPNLGSDATQTLQLLKTTAAQGGSETLQALAASGLSSKVTLTVDGVQYTASLADGLKDTTPINWLSGKVVNEWMLNAPLKNAAGATHPLLTVRFDVRWYSGLSKQARVDVVVENSNAFKPAHTQNYDVDVEVGGRSIYNRKGFTHYYLARWHQAGWWDGARQPNIHVQHNADYLMASKAISNYDRSVVPAENALADMAKQLTASNTGPMTIGPLVSYMPTAGGRGDIGPLPMWTVMYLLSGDKRARDAMMAAADGSGTWAVHYRDHATDQPIRTDNEAYKMTSTHGNMGGSGPLPVPRCANNDPALCNTPYIVDTAHQPSIAYVPYLLTGDYYYLEELQFWAATNPLATAPGNHGFGQGLLRWQQIRGQAWSLRTLGHSAYITPDNHPLKSYFTKQLDNNLNFYHETYVVGNPNKLGAYDGSGLYAAEAATSPPWQDDFLTWSFGYLSELGFTKATPILQWKAKYPVGRMTAPGYCWIQGAAYNLKFRESVNTPVYDSFEKLYQVNFGNDTIMDDGGNQFKHPKGLKYIDQPCGSQAQADFLAATNGHYWELGRMAGYSDSTIGYPSNMQPALAVAVASGVPNASQAWSILASRTAKPNYAYAPQWAIIPR